MKKPELLVFGIDGASPEYILRSVKQGRLPGFKRLMEKGIFFNDFMTVFPSISPTCWSSIETGAVPKVHGALCQTMHERGAYPYEFITPYSSKHVHAERFWESAARIGKKSLLVDVLCSGPAKCDNVMQIMGGQTISPDRDAGQTYMSGIPQQYFNLNGNGESFVSGSKAPSGAWTFTENKESVCRRTGENIYEFVSQNTDARHDETEVERFSWTVITEENGVRIGENEEKARMCRTVKENEWSEVIKRKLVTSSDGETVFTFRARLQHFDAETKAFSIYMTAAKNLYKEVTPKAYARELEEIDEVAPTNAHGAFIWQKDSEADVYLDCEDFVFDWHRKVIAAAIGKHDNDIIFDSCGLIDTVNHRFRSIYEEVGEGWGGTKEQADAVYERAYKMVDKHISWLMDNACDENTVFAIFSDHGSVGWSETENHCKALEKAGLIVYTDDREESRSWENKNVDWTKTRAYPVGSCHINVNLKGREPCGIVEEKDFEDTVNEIIDALYGGIKTADGKINGTAFAVDGSQAGFVGLGGENCGDVVYGIKGSRLGGFYGQVHGTQIPSARTKTGDIRALCIMSGKCFKENAVLERPTDLTDFAPTLCYAMKYPQPADATGGVVFAAFKEGDGIYNEK